MPTLLELQRSLARHLLADSAAIEAAAAVAVDCATERNTAAARLAIYRNTALSTLTRALGLSYPAVQRLVGAEFFAAVVGQFIKLHPPKSAYLNAYGGEFAQFLRHCEPAASLPYLADVAELEWAVNRALYAPERQRLDPARLSKLEASALARIAFIAHPSLSVLQLRHPADLIWRAVLEQDEARMRAIDLTAGPVWLLIERDVEDLVQVWRLRASAWRLSGRLLEGQALHRVLAQDGGRAVDEGDSAPAEEGCSVLAQHLAAGRFVDFQITAECVACEHRAAHAATPGEQPGWELHP
jgi:hypothetical protein